MIKLVLTDLDNTLIPFGKPHASERAIAGVHALLDAGVHFGPMTGRVPAAMEWMFAGDADCGKTGAYVNGQMVYVDGEPVRVEMLDVDALNKMAAVIAREPDCALVVYDIQNSFQASDGTAYFMGATVDEMARVPEVFGTNLTVIDRLDWDQCIKANVRCACSSARKRELRDELRNRFPQFDFVFPVADGIFIDLLPAGWGKGHAVKEICTHLGIGLDEVAAFGDSENDLSMLGAVEHSVAVANASEAVAAASRWHIGASADDAVADALFSIAKAARTGAMPDFMRWR